MPITPAQTQQMCEYRREALDDTCAMPNRSNYATDAEYRQALLDTYQALRQTEYEYTVLNECTKTYNFIRDARACHYTENSGLFTGYSRYISGNATRTDQYNNCALHRAKDMAYTCINTELSSSNSCSLCATSNLAQISGQMGYDGNENLIKVKLRSAPGSLDWTTNNILTPEGMCRCDSVDVQYCYPTNAKRTITSPQGKCLSDMVREGKVGVGDAVSLWTGKGATNTSTGYHAVTIAAIHRDDNDNITSYTIQSANVCHLQEFSVNSRSSFAGMPVCSAVSTHGFINDKINNEVHARQNMSTAELEAEVTRARTQAERVIQNLQQSEEYCAKKGYTGEIQSGYMRDLAAGERAHNNRYDVADIEARERANAEKEQRLRAQEQDLARRENEQAQREQNFLRENPDMAEFLAGQKANDPYPRNKPDAVEIPAATTSNSLADRARSVADRERALEQKEAELSQREDILNREGRDLATTESEANLTAGERRRRREEQEREAERQRKAAEREAERQRKAAEREARRQAHHNNNEGAAVLEGSSEGTAAVLDAAGTSGKAAILDMEGVPDVGVRPRQQAEFKGAYTEAEIEGQERAKEEQLTNERIAAQGQNRPAVLHIHSDGTMEVKGQTEEQPQSNEPTKPTRSVNVSDLIRASKQRK